MLAIIWLHIKACAADLHARRVGNAESVDLRAGGQVWVTGRHRQWRIR